MPQSEGYIIEFIAVGNSVKVTAVDPHSLKEVSIIGDKKASQEQLTQLAIRKLNYVLGKENS